MLVPKLFEHHFHGSSVALSSPVRPSFRMSPDYRLVKGVPLLVIQLVYAILLRLGSAIGIHMPNVKRDFGILYKKCLCTCRISERSH